MVTTIITNAIAKMQMGLHQAVMAVQFKYGQYLLYMLVIWSEFLPQNKKYPGP